tara:strand:- start:3162 stop:3551 length:390 start_codon:yes stop_codon:yes gene_type:complete
MIYTTIYSSPHTVIPENNHKIIYTNTINDTMNRRYCLLRADAVILLEKNPELQKECEWLDIPCIYLHDVSKLQEFKRFYIFSQTKERHTLNEIFKIIKPIAEEKDIIIFSENVDSAGILIANAIKERIK